MTDAIIIDGKSFAAGLRARIGRQVAVLTKRHGIIPGLAAVLVGDDPASQIYVRSKEKQTAEAGMASMGRRLDSGTSQDDLLAIVNELNADPGVHGILVQLPLPDQIDTRAIIEAVDPAKDVDGFHPINVGRLVNGEAALVPLVEEETCVAADIEDGAILVDTLLDHLVHERESPQRLLASIVVEILVKQRLLIAPQRLLAMRPQRVAHEWRRVAQPIRGDDLVFEELIDLAEPGPFSI